jgi:hypothetical protein
MFGLDACQLELLSAKYLIGANLDGSSDPFAVISCGEQKRFRYCAVNIARPPSLHIFVGSSHSS